MRSQPLASLMVWTKWLETKLSVSLCFSPSTMKWWRSSPTWMAVSLAPNQGMHRPGPPGNPTFKIWLDRFSKKKNALLLQISLAVPFDPNIHFWTTFCEPTTTKPENPSRIQNKKGVCPKMRDSSKSPIWRERNREDPFWAHRASDSFKAAPLLSSWLSTIQHWPSKAARPGLGCRVYHDYWT